MGFYREWLEADSTDLIEKYVRSFLLSDTESCEPFFVKDTIELQAAYTVLSDTNLAVFIESIRQMQTYPELTIHDVLCFSKLENGVSRLNELLEFSPDGLTFAELGEQLAGSANQMGRIKYGENQSKLASSIQLVEISNTRPALVTPTAWGSFLTRFSFHEKETVIKKMLLRNRCVQSLIGHALAGKTSLNELTLFLAPSTRIRRMSNVRTLVSFVLIQSEYEDVLSNIDWTIKG